MSNERTTTSVSQPLSDQARPTLDMLLGGVQDAYRTGPQVFNQPLYAGVGDTTRAGWNSMFENATSRPYADAVHGGINYNGGLIGSGGLTGGQSGNMTQLQGIGQGYGDLAGAYDQNAPGYDTLRSTLLNDAVKGVTGNYLQAPGLLGSRAFTEDATNAAVNAIAPLDYQNYQNNVNNRYRSLDSRAGIQSQLFGMGQQGVNNAFGAQDRLGGLYDLSMRPGQTLAQIGGAQDADRQASLLAQNDLFRRNADSRTNLLSQLSSILAGTAGAGGTSTTNTDPGQPWWQTALGAGLGIGGLFL